MTDDRSQKFNADLRVAGGILMTIGIAASLWFALNTILSFPYGAIAVCIFIGVILYGVGADTGGERMSDSSDITECPRCGDPVYRVYEPTYNNSIWGEDIGDDVRFCVIEQGLIMHVYGSGIGREYTPKDGPEVRD